jgi:Carboxypeptidase regulatory-like domain
MRRTSSRSLSIYLGMVLAACASCIPFAWAQHGSEGTVTVTVLDPSGSVVEAAKLELRDTATGEVRSADTQEKGTHTFVNLSPGKYELAVKKAGFHSQVFTDVVVQAAQTTDISASLRVGAINETVEVRGGAAPLVETTTNMIGTTIDMKQIEDLPIQGRDLGQLSLLIPGYTGGQNGGTWNGLPAIDQGNNVDGVIGSSSRMKFSGNSEPAISPRLESIEEMTVQTEQLDMNQGFGQASMQINFVTRRGGNAFHGRVFEDFRNAVLNAQSWANDAANYLDPSNPLKKNPIKLNDFGGSLGGPIIKGKLFFFGTYAESKQPGVVTATNWILTPAAQSGAFTYVGTDNNTHTANLYSLAQAQGVNRPLSANTAAVFAAYPSLNGATVTALPDPNVQQITWQVPNPVTYYYPAVRVDFTPNDKMRFNVAWNMTKFNYPVNTNFPAAVPDFPGADWNKTGGGVQSKNYTAAFGFEYTVSPTVVNEFRGGFLYNWALYSGGAAPLNANVPQVGWNYPGAPYPLGTQMSGTVDYVPTGTYYPIFNASDTVNWQHRAHTMSFGFSWYQEQDHYYNGVQGFPVANLGLAAGDPAQNAFTNATLPFTTGTSLAANAQQMYAILTGTVSGVNGQYAYDPQSHQFFTGQLNAYNLDELQRAWALHFQDSYRLRPNLTLNYGLRWDFTGPDHDLTGLYHSATPAAIFGPSGVNNLFNPGSLQGDMNPVLAERPRPYNSWNVSPQPAFGIAWNPHGGSGWLGRLMGGDRTVIRAGVSLKKFTEPQQYFWNQASDGGSFYYQSFNLYANNNGGSSNFAPGSFQLSTPSLFNNNAPFQLPAGKAYVVSPQTFQVSEALSDFTFVGGPGANGIDPNIKQPYTESWNLGIQRQLGENRALEIRYVGNRTLRQWMYEDINEVNIFQSGPFGVLTNVKAAQSNLAINNASGNPNLAGSFANHNITGQQATPLFDAAFAGEGVGADGKLADYTNANLSAMIGTGQAGGIGGALTTNNGTAPYFCNLVGASFGPCSNALNGVNYTGPGAGLPINFLQANPFASGNGALYLMAEGYSNYNGLQVDFRQRQWHGLQFDANYTWSHTLGLTTPNNWQGQTYTFTMRNMRLGYGPSLFDIRHSININGTYDLPFGKGKAFANTGGVVDKIVGGWTLGSILNFQTGTPFLLGAGNGAALGFGSTAGDPNSAETFNNNSNVDGLGDGGVVLHGVTPSQLQSSIGVYRIPGQAAVDFINPKFLANNGVGGGANPAYLTPNTTPGTIGQRVWLYGPHFWNDDFSISKNFPIRESVRFTFQAEMLNVFNHPNFQPGPGAGCNYNCYTGFSPFIQANGFGIGGISPNFNIQSPNQGARVIELRANIAF